ncbi:hypothetical protein [Actinoplanes sp. NPDC026670]|uniref:hypothetical protein n=1 Tax=Actinoplanes sp. NPDC026670 TaxID=3154700 RepID=UPI0033FDAA4F
MPDVPLRAESRSAVWHLGGPALLSALQFLKRTGEGRAISLWGSPSVTSLLVAEYLDRSGLPVVRWTPGTTITAAGLDDLTAPLPDSGGIVAVEDLPAAVGDLRGESYLQIAWDRRWSRRPVLLLLTGEGAPMREMVSYDRPLYGRATIVDLDAMVRDCEWTDGR